MKANAKIEKTDSLRVMIVANNKAGQFAPFVMDQVAELERLGVEFVFYPILGKGIWGYLKELPKLKKAIKTEKPDLIHAHYGLSGLLANLQRIVPVITTFHGSDVNIKKNQKFSKLAFRLSKESIFVSEKLQRNLKVNSGKVIPCGIDLNIFNYSDKKKARAQLGLDSEKKYVLFSSSFCRLVKNYPLAQAAMNKFNNNEVELLELKGFAREEIPIIMSACDCGLVTSHSESGPLFVQEAIACRLPIISVHVGEVENYFQGTEGNYLVERKPEEIYEKIELVLTKNERSKSYKKEQKFNNKAIAERILELYKTCS